MGGYIFLCLFALMLEGSWCGVLSSARTSDSSKLAYHFSERSQNHIQRVLGS